MGWMAFALGWTLMAAWGLSWAALPPFTADRLVGILLGSGVLIHAASHRHQPWQRGVLAGLAGATAGLVMLVAAGQEAIRHRWSPALESRVAVFEGCIEGLPQITPGRVRFDLRPVAGAEPARRIRLAWYRSATVPRPGERWQVNAKLRAPRGLVNPGGADYTLALLQAGVDATGSVRTARRLTAGVCAEAAPGWQARVDGWRDWLAARLSAAAGQQASPSGLGLLLALALGFQDRIPDADWRVFAITGVSHLVAVSGLHVTLFAALVLGLARMIRGRGHLAPPASLGPFSRLVAVLAAAAYASLAGGNLPAWRTVWMLAIALAVHGCRRETGIALPWAMALVLALAMEPFAVASLGFWLSFGAVGALLWAAAARLPGTPPAGADPRWRRELREFLQVQGVVTLVLAPLLAASVGLPGWISLPVNAVAIPLFSLLLVPAVLLATLCVTLWPAVGAAIMPALVAALDTVIRGLEVSTHWPGSQWSPAAPGWVGAAGVLLLALLATSPLVPRRWRLVCTLAAVAVLVWPRPALLPGSFRLTVLDVGQGSAAVIETARRRLVFDPGPAYGPESDAGERVVVPFLRAGGTGQVDAVVVSHADTDHSAGLPALLQHSPQAVVWWGGDAGAARHDRQPCRAGLVWHHDGVLFRFLHPGVVAESDDNAGSCVLWVAAGGEGALLLADIPRRVEDRLFPHPAWPARVVLVAHHGSTTASGATLRAATRIAGGGHAIVSAGYGNRWGFPKAAVVEGWRTAGRQVWTTAAAGAITVEIGPAGTRVSGLRDTAPRWWRAGPGGGG